MRRLTTCMALTVFVALALAAPAGAAFGLKGLEVRFEDSEGNAVTQAGAHPFAIHTKLAVNTKIDPQLGEIPDDSVKDFRLELPAGLTGILNAAPPCAAADFATTDGEGHDACPDASAVGVLEGEVGTEAPAGFPEVPIYNLVPPPGVAAKIGFVVLTVPVTINIGVEESFPYNAFASIANIPQALFFYGSDAILWGNPADPAHDPYRGNCLEIEDEAPGVLTSTGEDCPAKIPQVAFLTLPRSCDGPLGSLFAVRSWQHPGTTLGYPLLTPPGMTGCSKLGFAPEISSRATTDEAESPSGLDFGIDVSDPGLANPTGLADSEAKKVVVKLPPGVTANPSLAEGLVTCSSQDFAEESLRATAEEGCPEASKIGSIEVETPILAGELIKGQVYLASQSDNPFGSLLAIYLVIKHPARGAMIKLAGKIEPEAGNGRLVTTVDGIPQIPFSHFRFHFREGGRSPLITPPSCGTYATEAEFTPWADPSRSVSTTASFRITRGVGGAPCPAGPPPFLPGFSAGSLDSSAAAHTSFHMRLTRRDGDQDLSRFSAVLPPGVLGTIAGVQKCSEQAIAAAKSRSGREEIASPSCPPGSQLGTTLAAAGVGSQLTYVPGRLYLAGPFGGDPLSVVAITPAVAGPFDVGVVVVREAVDADSRTAEVQADGAASDPIPHILEGIPLKLRELRVNVDRDRFVLNPTNCDVLQTRAFLTGAGTIFNPAGDTVVGLTSPFQASDCAALGFRPHLRLHLRGSTHRGGHPALRSEYRARAGDANLKDLSLLLPRSEFVENAHFRTICTRVQFAAHTCPAGSIYGRARAFTPILDEPLEGPVYLRSSSHALPDLVIDLHGLFDVEVAARVDSVHGRLRVTIQNAPDAPVSKVLVNMQGGRKGLIVNSQELCSRANRAAIDLTAQSNRRRSSRPLVSAAGCKQHHRRHGKRR